MLLDQRNGSIRLFAYGSYLISDMIKFVTWSEKKVYVQLNLDYQRLHTPQILKISVAQRVHVWADLYFALKIRIELTTIEIE